VAFALAQAGVDVLGVDAMPSMLAHARARRARLPRAVRERVTLRRGDMRSLRLGRKFPLVIAPFNAFTHLYTRKDFERALRVCREHLLPRGRLVFDVVMPDLRALAQDPERLYKCGTLLDPGDGVRYAHHEASHYDAEAQVRSVTIVLESAARSRALPLTQRQLFPAELEALLHYNGFAIERRHGDFSGGALRADSESQVIVARRARD
jgi:SAM-dependent methyltransferase